MQFLTPLRSGTELNQVERWKLERHPLNVYQSVIDTYSKEGVGAIAKVDGEVERLKWVGIYPQRQGGDAFMMRVKVPGGRLTSAQARTVGEIAGVFGRGADPHPIFGDAYCDITTRQTIQLHWIKVEDIPTVWERLAAVGMTTVQACGDSARNVLCCPVSGIDAEEAFDAYPVARAISDYFTGNREYANLPRKFKMSVTGCLDDCAQAEINDIGMWPARLDDGTLGFNLLVGGGLSDGPRMGTDIDVFVCPDQAVEITRAIAQLFGELGNRENRGVCRMRYLVQELGPEGFRAALAERAAFDLIASGESLTRRYRGDHIGVHPQKDPGSDTPGRKAPGSHTPGRKAPGKSELYYVGLNVTVGRLVAESLIGLADLAETYGDGEIRLTTDQNAILTGVPADKLDDLLGEPLLTTHSPHPRPFERGVVACTGTEFCRFAIVETKARAATWARMMDDRFAGLTEGDEVVRMHFSGCSASCAQPQIADIGFRGETAFDEGRIVEAVDIGLGGSLGHDARFIDWVEGAKPVEQVPEALGHLFERYAAERRPGESFRQWVRRSPNATLREVMGSGTR